MIERGARLASPEHLLQSLPWIEVKGINSCKGKSGIVSFHGFLIMMGWDQKALALDKRTHMRVLLTNMPQCCHSSCHKESGVTENGWTKVNCQSSEHNRRWRRPYDVLVEATHREIRYDQSDEELDCSSAYIRLRYDRSGRELDCSSAYIHLRELCKSEDKVEGVEAEGAQCNAHVYP
ncbi:hypothetical protein BHE74_00042121 [Ensete ventricosum]|nr:hypothetical protein BHE74_00042121 [Ensete ventricosum]